MEYYIIAYFGINSLLVAYFYKADFLPIMNRYEKWFVGTLFLFIALPVLLFAVIYSILRWTRKR